ncbi:choice-of-anchor A family protein [Lacrimispora sp. JR3]|uniref:choice-of-anchor A family protein n=1 Tax=Lacrimispora sinapis TaxID=3111456 RepID=UPI003747B82D
MDNISNSNGAVVRAGLPYDNINWYNIDGQPFGSASGFNLIVFNDANNIIDVEGPVAIGGNFYSPRGMSVGFARDSGYRDIGYSPDLVRFFAGGNVSTSGPLVVVGHVVGGSGFRVAKGSTYLIGKDGTADGLQELKYLYQANGGSQYWTPTDKGDHYVVPSYDVPRFIPASRIEANIPGFFNDAREGIEYYKNCIEALTPNGSVVDNNYEWILRGDDPVQNVFLIDVRPNGLINKGIRAEVPQGSTVIVRLKTGPNAHLQYGLYGERDKAPQTLYVFEDATNIYMEKSSDFWGSILAPQAMFHAHPTGGHVSGTAALGSFAVNAASGFEFHYFPFAGSVMCQDAAPAPVAPTPVVPAPEEQPALVCPEPAPCPEQKPCPAPEPCPTCPTCPVPEPCPTCPTCPAPEPCPVCPEPEPCPTCPACPEQKPCPEPEPCPVCPTCPTCPAPEPCPACPTPVPCPECPVCPTCPTCPVCPEQEVCPVCDCCLVEPCFIRGCICGCRCYNYHEWDVELYNRFNGVDILLYCVRIDSYGCFEFEVPYEGCYVLKVRQSENSFKTFRCKPILILKNVGVENLMVE